jgi:2,2-dialkylglycine decarboxylase (pyruvate)
LTERTSIDARERYLFPYGGSFAPFVVARAEGAWLETTDGRRVLDFTSGQMCSTIGHNHPRITEAIKRSTDEVIHLNSWMLSEPVLELGRKLGQLTPDPLEKVILLSTGSEVNEAALKLAKMYTNGFEVVGLTRSFHGLMGATSAVTYSMAHAGYGPLTPGNMAIPAPYAYRCPIKHCEGSCDMTCLDVGFELVDQESVGALSAMVIEPILSTGGMIELPDGYLRRAQQHCRDRGMLLILDEAQTAFGRLGTMFGFESDEIVPDVLAVSKTLGGGLPLAATVTTAEIQDTCLERGFYHGSSHVSDPLPAAAGEAVLDVVIEDGLVERARLLGAHLRARLEELQNRHEPIGDIRGRGLLLGFELVKDRDTKEPWDELGSRLTDECLARDLSMNIVRVGWAANCIRMAPPLSITQEELDTGIEIIDAALTAVLASVSRTGESSVYA